VTNELASGIIARSEITFLEWEERPGQLVEIVDINVNGDDRLKGIGRGMVEELIKKQVPPTTLVVFARTRATNKAAQDFYCAIGMNYRGKIKGLYRDTGEDALVYAIDL